MRTLLFFTLLLGFNASFAQAQNPCRHADEAREHGESNGSSVNFTTAKIPFAKSIRTREQGGNCMLSRMNKEVIKQFEIAWRNSGNGMLAREGLVLIYRDPDGSYRAEQKGLTNEYRKFTFVLDPDAIAIVHTHPNEADPKPQPPDIQIADRRGVLMFTITLTGMFMYDPATKRITKVKKGLDWLEPSGWMQDSRLP